MPLYEYTAISDAGKKVKAMIDANSLQEAKLKLIRRQIAVLELESLSDKKLQAHLNRSDVLNLTREVARLLQAGLPLFEALSALEEKYRGQKNHKLLLDLCDSVRSGHSLSQSLARHPRTFDLLYVSMVANSEKTGSLGVALQELADLLSRQQQVRKQIVSALLYPALLSGFCVVILCALLFYVIPSLRELFEGRELHPFTRLVFAASHFACRSKGLLALFVIGGAGLGLFALFSKPWKQKLFAWTLRLPILKEFFAKVAFVRFFRAAATLLDGSLPLIQAFEQARRVMGHPLLEAVIAHAEEQIAQGESIQKTFENHPLIPPLIPRMIGIAEEGGKLPFMMQQIAQVYEEELEKTLTQFAALAQPILLLVLGAIIGFVLLSVLLPMTDVSS
ncbi:MAG: type II secretion system F family protein, partial [Verrucomicrobia bacterium]|nr:type II secretion system F family protein [Verrucomicrobiota bacterium]